MRALKNTSFRKLRLAPRLESPFASRALQATLAARRTRRVNREVARYDGAWSRTHPTTHRLPDIPSAEKGLIRHDDAEATAACPCGRQKKKKSANDPLAQATGTETFSCVESVAQDGRKAPDSPVDEPGVCAWFRNNSLYLVYSLRHGPLTGEAA